MVASNFIQDKLEAELAWSKDKGRKAYQLVEDGIVGERFGGYLKNIVYIRTCLNIAKLFAEAGDREGMESRVWEASYKLREIDYVYAPETGEAITNIVELASEEFNHARKECDTLLEARAS